MALTDVRIKRSLSVSETKDDKGVIERTGSQELLIISDTANPSFSVILADATYWAKLGGSIPQCGDTASVNGVSMQVTSREVEFEKDNERVVVMKLKYSSKVEPPEEPDKPDQDDPDTWLRMTVTNVQTTKPALGWRSLGDVPIGDAAPLQKEGTALNSAGEPVDGLEEESSQLKFTYTNTRVVNPIFTELIKYTNRVNSTEFLGCAAYSVRVVGWNAEYDQKSETWTVSVEFHYNPDTWVIQYYDVGYNEMKDGQRVAILDKRGNPVSKPVPLVSGSAAPINATPSSGQLPISPQILELYPYRQSNMGSIFTDCGI